MAGWRIYLKERFPLGTYLILSLGFALSGAYFTGGNQNWLATFFATLGLLLFFGELRLMDELKDYQKDLIAHPERPLPRKVIGLRQVQKTVAVIFFLMMTYSGFMALFFNPLTGILYLGISLYLGLMYQEFFMGPRLSRFPLIYAITHQIILIPLCLFTFTIHSATLFQDSNAWAYSISVLGAFFGYEVCRKLDPEAHPVLKTYLSVYGPGRTVLLVLCLLFLAGLGAHGFQAHLLLWPMEIILALSLTLILLVPKQFKVVEGFATLSLTCHIWSVPIQLLMKKVFAL